MAPLHQRLWSAGPSEKSDAQNEMAALKSQKPEVLRRTDGIDHGRGVLLIRQIVHANPERETMSMHGCHPLQREIAIEMEGEAKRIHQTAEHPVFLLGGKRKSRMGIEKNRGCPIFPREGGVAPTEKSVWRIPRRGRKIGRSEEHTLNSSHVS